MRRVAVTGMGAISACGLGREQLWKSLCAGTSGIGPIESVDCSRMRYRNGAEVRGFDPEKHFGPGVLALLDRFAQLTLAAADEAVRDASLELGAALLEKTAVVTGSSMGGQATQEQAFQAFYQRNGRVHPLGVPRTMANAGASHIAMRYGVTGPAYTVSTACASSNHAIGQAFRMVRSGEADLAIAGGGEAPFVPGHLAAWDSMRVVASDTCRPFCLERKGMILGEGAAILVLEPLETARARGARIYAELAGFGMTSDAHHIMQPSAGGEARAILAALADAGLRAEEIGHINAHGTGTQANDATETAAIRQAFGAHADRITVSATKSMHGHALGASGGLEAVATVLALLDGVAPPTANFGTPDPKCDLDVMRGEARRIDTEAALSNSFAFGGMNAVLAFRRFSG